MNAKKFILTLLVVFIALTGLEMLIHMVILRPDYEATKQLWRTEAEMEKFMGAMMLGRFLVAFSFLVIISNVSPGKLSPTYGALYGFFMGLFAGGGQLIMYAVQPYPLALVVKWIAFGCAQSVIIGVIAARLLKPSQEQ